MTILRTNTIAGTGTTFGPLLDGNLEFNSQNYIILPKGTSSQEGVLRNTADVVGTGGTYYDNLVLAMPFNEATGFLDVSSRNRNPAVYGNVAISTAQSKYYGSSAYFDGTDDYLSVAGIGSDFYLNEAFTIEMWAYVNAYDTDGSMLIHQQNGTTFGGFEFWISPSGIIRLNRNESSGMVISSSGAVNPIGSWNHFAATWDKSTAYIFVNGSLIVSNTTSIGPTNVNGPIRIGGWVGSSSYDLNGHLQDLRIYKGLAKYTSNFTPPDRIAEVGVGFKTGQLRYNTDSNKVELYDGNQWTEVQSSRPDLNGGARGLWGGGVNPASNSNVIDYVTISSTGNAQDFGDVTAARRGITACSSSTRGLFAGGYQSSPTIVTYNIIDYITISSTGDAQDFGDLSVARGYFSACSSPTRGLFGGGSVSGDTIDYVTISSTGNAQDFGNLITSRGNLGACSSPTRGLFGGGGGTIINSIDFVTISTLGNAQDFGDLTAAKKGLSACSNATRGVFGGGYTPTILNVVDYVTISTTGNAVKFGDLTASRFYISSCSSPTRGLFGGGYNAGSSNVLDYLTILTQGNAVDFGDLTEGRHLLSSCSNAHGGL